MTGPLPGTLLRHEPVDTGLAGARAWKVHYVSRDVNNVEHEASGLVIAPAGDGVSRPILTWCHGTTGLGDAACPSAQPDPARELTVYFTPEATQQIDYGVPGVQGFIDAGWVVCATDYQGLGTEGMHQYTVNITNARDAVNIAHAAGQLGVGAGTQVGCAGWSQGGGAAAAVAELDDDDYRDLRLVGTVPMSLGVAKIALQNPSGISAALTDPSVPPDSHLVMVLAGIQAANPSTLQLSDVFTPLGIEIIEKAWNTQPVHHLNDTVARLFRLKGAVLNPNPTNFTAWEAAIAAGSAGGRKPIAPVLVCIDSFDGGTMLPVGWQTAYVDIVKSFGGTVEVRDYPNDDHFSLPQSCVADARAWLTDKLD
ncbi:lipase family protein [Mycolicibacterium sp.]|uniref:lipase family protein n=1 Tax=Mycolicibacterium sp. TaxID=2320850 RepID=UPI0028ABA06C|nr:lipase family protein [Mycolicibacterium sp.]